MNSLIVLTNGVADMIVIEVAYPESFYAEIVLFFISFKSIQLYRVKYSFQDG